VTAPSLPALRLRVLDFGDLPRPLPGRSLAEVDPEIEEAVRSIIDEVRQGGDDALRRVTERFDGVTIGELRVSDGEIDAAYEVVDADFLPALREAIDAVRTFHLAQTTIQEPLEVRPGVEAWRVWRPVRRVGLYVPGGRARYPSTMVMLGVPAQAAGCVERVLVSPPGPDGAIPSETLVAAREVGITEVYRVGGAQAIGALAYGTESIGPVDKIFGPGNAYVTSAKLEVFPRVAIDLPAGPSELLIIADESVDPAWVAADMLANAEHGPDSPVILISTSAALLEAVEIEMRRQLASLPRAEIAATALAGAGWAVVAPDLDEACCLADEFAPEHLELMVADPDALLGRIHNAGSVFLGPCSPNAAGDYATGTNHVLPTGGSAKAFGALSVADFGRYMEVQRLSSDGMAKLGSVVAVLARAEGLEGHARAAEARLGAPESDGRGQVE